ncbi:MAG TPA: hypothetical protein PLQ56_07480 [Aggregatilineales bacterium]|nr:hypothetical protein [Aggregatilineales bacterium]
MNDDYTQLDWKPILLVKVTRLPFGEMHTGLLVKRLYLAEHPDGILRADWTLAADERFYPLVQLVGWKPLRDVPFKPPVKFQRQGDARVVSLIPSGTWVLPYDDNQYHLYERVQITLQTMLEQVEKSPTNAQTLHMLTRWIA